MDATAPSTQQAIASARHSLRWLGGCALFRGLEEKALADILNSARECHAPKKGFFFVQDAPALKVCCPKEGC